eukprot:scpid96458/ scgid3458/ 
MDALELRREVVHTLMKTRLTIPRLADMRRQGLQHAEQSLLYAREGAEQFHRRLSCELAHGEEVLPDCFTFLQPHTSLRYPTTICYPTLPLVLLSLSYFQTGLLPAGLSNTTELKKSQLSTVSAFESN